MEYRRYGDTLYFVYEDGRVWCAKGNGRWLKWVVSPIGYCYVSVKGKGVLVHRMVCECWHGAPAKGMEVNHKDGNKKNNHWSNLEWCTRQENVAHAISLGLIDVNIYKWLGIKKFKDVKRRARKVSDELAEKLRLLIIEGRSYKDLGKEFGISARLVYLASNGLNGHNICGPRPKDVRSAKIAAIRDKKKREVAERKEKRVRIKEIKKGIKEPVKADWSQVYQIN